jgi:hypothetical protein
MLHTAKWVHAFTWPFATSLPPPMWLCGCVCGYVAGARCPCSLPSPGRTTSTSCPPALPGCFPRTPLCLPRPWPPSLNWRRACKLLAASDMAEPWVLFPVFVCVCVCLRVHVAELGASGAVTQYGVRNTSLECHCNQYNCSIKQRTEGTQPTAGVFMVPNEECKAIVSSSG